MPSIARVIATWSDSAASFAKVSTEVTCVTPANVFAADTPLTKALSSFLDMRSRTRCSKIAIIIGSSSRMSRVTP